MVIAIETGEITVFGNRLGTGLPKDTNTPVDITLESKHQIITISSGNYHNAILTEFGQLYTWGCDIFGQLGHGDFR